MVSLSLFKKKPKATPGKPGAGGRVKELSAQGLSEVEILRSLRAEGYGPGEVDQAMKGVLKEAVAGAPPRPAVPDIQPAGAPPRQPPAAPPLPEMAEPPPGPGALEMAEFPPGRFAPPEEPMPAEPVSPTGGWRPPETAPLPPEPIGRAPLPPLEDEFEDEEMAPLPPPPGARRRGAVGRGDMEEIAESIVEERVRAIEGHVTELSRRLDAVSTKIASMEAGAGRGAGSAGVEEIKAGMESYRSSIGELSERTEAMERAIKDSLTPMMQSLRSLSETIRTLKQKQA